MPVPKLSPAQQEMLLQSLAQQLHCDSNTLRQHLQQGNFAAIAAMGGGKEAQRIFNNPQQIQQVMNSTEMKELLRRIQQN